MIYFKKTNLKNITEVTIINNFNYNKLIYKLQIIKYQFDKLIN